MNQVSGAELSQTNFGRRLLINITTITMIWIIRHCAPRFLDFYDLISGVYKFWAVNFKLTAQFSV